MASLTVCSLRAWLMDCSKDALVIVGEFVEFLYVIMFIWLLDRYFPLDFHVFYNLASLILADEHSPRALALHQARESIVAQICTSSHLIDSSKENTFAIFELLHDFECSLFDHKQLQLLDTFTLFSKFPLEIRVKIWSHTLPNNHKIELIAVFDNFRRLANFKSRTRLPISFRTSVESREATKPCYKVLLQDGIIIWLLPSLRELHLVATSRASGLERPKDQVLRLAALDTFVEDKHLKVKNSTNLELLWILNFAMPKRLRWIETER
ncbi:hypothetical protein EG329_002522 [Mollisiaceae sp. DMI_Dod_QoI]|nr:hypothetical protein EG329_002522 [Helotiales sp. DMI_Dod_QoI]